MYHHPLLFTPCSFRYWLFRLFSQGLVCQSHQWWGSSPLGGGIVEIFIGQRIYQNFLEIYAFIAKKLTSLKRIHTNCCFLLKVFRRHPFHRISRSPIHRRAWASEWRKSLGFRLHFVHTYYLKGSTIYNAMQCSSK